MIVYGCNRIRHLLSRDHQPKSRNQIKIPDEAIPKVQKFIFANKIVPEISFDKVVQCYGQYSQKYENTPLCQKLPNMIDPFE